MLPYESWGLGVTVEDFRTEQECPESHSQIHAYQGFEKFPEDLKAQLLVTARTLHQVSVQVPEPTASQAPILTLASLSGSGEAMDPLISQAEIFCEDQEKENMYVQFLPDMQQVPNFQQTLKLGDQGTSSPLYYTMTAH